MECSSGLVPHAGHVPRAWAHRHRHHPRDGPVRKHQPHRVCRVRLRDPRPGGVARPRGPRAARGEARGRSDGRACSCSAAPRGREGALHRHPVPAGVPRRHLDLRRAADRRRRTGWCYYGQTLVRARLRGHRRRRRCSSGDTPRLPLDALLAHLSGHFRSELLDARVTDVVNSSPPAWIAGAGARGASLRRKQAGCTSSERSGSGRNASPAEAAERQAGAMHAASARARRTAGEREAAEMCAWTSGTTCDRGVAAVAPWGV